MNPQGFQRFLVAVVLLTAAASPVVAETAARPCVAAKTCPAPPPLVLADSWSVGKLISSGGRSRVVQFCVVAMCIALFIMMRKLN